MNSTDLINNKKIVCLGGGIGTVNLLKGLRHYTSNISVVVSMADDGGSAGRLRRLYNVFPAGDVVSCIAAFAEINNEEYAKLLTYRFPGDRYGKDDEIVGHKVGNLMMAAAQETTGSFENAIDLFKKLFNVECNILPATQKPVAIKAITIDGIEVVGEENIDLGNYKGERVLDRICLMPEDARASLKVIEAIKNADVIIAGPGDLYTTILPVLIIPDISKAIIQNKNKKIFIVNVANKPFETTGYSVPDFISAIKKHMHEFPFSSVVANSNFSLPIPDPYKYSYVGFGEKAQNDMNIKLITGDLVFQKFPLYHDPEKLAQIVVKNI